jgi:flagellar export protein FliJ
MADKEPYRLEAVLTLRQRAEDAAKEELARKLQALRKEQQELQKRKDDLTAHQRKRAEWMKEEAKKFAKGAAAVKVQRAGRFGERLREEEIDLKERIPPQQEKVEQAQAEVDLARAALVEAQKQKKAIEQHKDNWLLEKKKVREAREEVAMDEIGQTIHDRARRG